MAETIKEILVWIGCVLFCAFFWVAMIRGCVGAEPVELSIVSYIESSNNPMAYNKVSQARGLYQITPICLKEYNQWHKGENIALNALYSPVVARKVAKWYIDVRIPQMLKAYKISDNLKNRLFAYNAGIGLVKRGIMPEETRQYISKYKRLLALREREIKG